MIAYKNFKIEVLDAFLRPKAYRIVNCTTKEVMLISDSLKQLSEILYGLKKEQTQIPKRALKKGRSEKTN